MQTPTEDKAEILAAIAASEARTMVRINTAVEELREELASVDGALRGDLDGKPGLLARVTTIEATEARRGSVVCAAVVAVAGAIGHAVWQVITQKP